MNTQTEREPLTEQEAFENLWNGHAVRICLPDEKNKDKDYPIFITDAISIKDLSRYSKEQSEKIIIDYLGAYEIYKNET